MKVELTYGSGTLKIEAAVDDPVARPHELMEMCERLVVRACRRHHGTDPDEGQVEADVCDNPGVQLVLDAIHADDFNLDRMEDNLNEGSYPKWVDDAIRELANLHEHASWALDNRGVEVDAVAGARDWLRAAIDGPDTEEGYRSNVDLPSLPDWVAPMVSEITEMRLRKDELTAAFEHIGAVVDDGGGRPGAQYPECIPNWARVATRHITALRAERDEWRAQLDALSAAPE